LRRLSAVVAALAVFVGCSSAVESTGSSADAITKCGDGYLPQVGQRANGAPFSYCAPYTIDLATNQSLSTKVNVCGSNQVAVPSWLSGLNCTLGMVVDGAIVWACPTTSLHPVVFQQNLHVFYVLPERTGLLTSTFGWCTAAQPDGTQAARSFSQAGTCEEIYVELWIDTSCFGAPNDGFSLVVDALADEAYYPPCVGTISTCKTGAPGACSGGNACISPHSPL
jgi:hypothetical protein